MSVVVRTDDGTDPRPLMVFGKEYPLGHESVCTLCKRDGKGTERDDLVVIKHPWSNRPLGQLVVRCPEHMAALHASERKPKPSSIPAKLTPVS